MKIRFSADSWRLKAAKRRFSINGSAARRGPGASLELASSGRCGSARPNALDGLADLRGLRQSADPFKKGRRSHCGNNVIATVIAGIGNGGLGGMPPQGGKNFDSDLPYFGKFLVGLC